MNKNRLSGATEAFPAELGDLPLPEGLILQIPGFTLRPFDENTPSPTRQAEIRHAYEENTIADRPPYTDVAIQTLGELLWIMEERHWSGDFDSEGKERADFRGADFVEADLRNASLHKGNFSQAKLNGADLSGANISQANLQDAQCMSANFHHADLSGVQAMNALFFQADLQEACCNSANFSAAQMEFANLSGTLLQYADLRKTKLYGSKVAGGNLQWADLRGAELTRAKMDSETILVEIKIDTTTHVGDVAWNGVNLTQIDWARMPRLGDETQANEIWWIQPGQNRKARKPASERIREYQRAARTYRSLALALKEQGLTLFSASSNVRAERMDCKILYHTIRLHLTDITFRSTLLFFAAALRWLKACVLYGFIWLSAHLGWLFLVYLAVNLLFTMVYWWTGIQAHTGISFLDAGVLSLTSFHGRGLQPAFGLTNRMSSEAGIEAVCGLFIEALFIAAFTRRVMGN